MKLLHPLHRQYPCLLRSLFTATACSSLKPTLASSLLNYHRHVTSSLKRSVYQPQPNYPFSLKRPSSLRSSQPSTSLSLFNPGFKGQQMPSRRFYSTNAGSNLPPNPSNDQKPTGGVGLSSTRKHQKLEDALKATETRILQAAEMYSQAVEQSRFKGISLIKIIVGLAAASLITFFIFEDQIYRYLGHGGAEVAAEVVKSAKLKQQVEEAVTAVLQELTNDVETRKSLILMLELVITDPALKEIVNEFGEKVVTELVQQDWFKKKATEFGVIALKVFSLSKSKHVSKSFKIFPSRIYRKTRKPRKLFQNFFKEYFEILNYKKLQGMG